VGRAGRDRRDRARERYIDGGRSIERIAGTELAVFAVTPAGERSIAAPRTRVRRTRDELDHLIQDRSTRGTPVDDGAISELAVRVASPARHVMGRIKRTRESVAGCELVMSSGPRGGGGRAAIVEGTRFSRMGLPPGRYTVEATAGADGDGQSVEIKPGETTRVELRSRGTGTLEGTVSELATRKPLAGMRCDAKISMNGQASPVPSAVAHQAFTDAAGNFKMSAPRGRVRLFCFSPNPAPLSAAGTDVEVTSGSAAKANVFSVRATFGNAPSDPGFLLTPMLLPLTVKQVIPSGPAAAAGLRVGDQLVTIDGVSLAGVLPAGAAVLLMNHRPGTGVTLGISRAGVAQTIKVVVGAAQ
jgi:hypothetical protein